MLKFKLYKIVKPLLVILSVFYSITNGIAQSEPHSFMYYEIKDISSKNLIKGVVKDAKGYIWLATDDGVVRFDGQQTETFYKEFESAYTKDFLLRDNGDLLLITDLGLYQIISNEDTTFFKSVELKGKAVEERLNYPKSIYEDLNGNIWIGEFNSILKISADGLHRYDLGEPYRSISYHRSFSFAEDAFGHLWIAPYKGRLLNYDSNLDSLIDVNIDYPITTVSTIISVKGDHLLIGGKEGLLKLKVDSDKNILASEFISQLKDISTGYTVSNRQVFIGTWYSGLYQFDFETGSFAKMSEVPFNDIVDIHYDHQINEMWLTGSENTGLLKGTAINYFDKIGKNRIESVTIDKDDILYYSIGQELFSFDGQQVKDVLSSKQTFFTQIIKDKSRLWIGDPFGSIFYYDISSGVTKVIQESTLSGIKHAYQDSYGNKWFSGNSNWLSKIDLKGDHITFPVISNSSVVSESPSGLLFCGAQSRDSLIFRYDKNEDTFRRINIQYNFQPGDNITVMDMDFDQDQNMWLATDEGLVKVAFDGGIYQKAKKIKLEGMPLEQSYRALRVTGGKIWLVNDNGLICYQDDHLMLYTNENGLPSKIIKDKGLILDRSKNRMLVATAKGLASVALDNMQVQQTKIPIIKSLQVNNQKQYVSEKGTLKFPHNARIEVKFNTLSYPGNNLVYQTRILGLEKEWSSATENQNISIMGFAQGNYTLQVRARSSGELWSEPLQLSFSILPAWYSTWWAYILFVVVGIALITISVKLYNVHLIRQKKRLQQIIESRTGEINRQKNEIIDQKNKIITQKEELIEKNRTVLESQNALSEADLKFYQLKEKQLQDQIEFKNKQITTHTLNIIQKNETLRELKNELEVLVKRSNGEAVEIRKTLRKIDESFKLDKDWDEFKLYFEQVYTGFYTKLKLSYPEISNQELRHCALIRLNLTANECASILGISPDSIKVSRTRIRKKLNLQGTQSLSDFILSI